MATKTKPETNAATIDENKIVDPLFDNELLYAEDEDGERVPEANVEAEATRVILVKWRVGKLNHVAEIRPGQITYAQRRAPSLYAEQFAVSRGLFEQSEAELKENPEKLALLQSVNAQLETDETYLLKRAELICGAVVKDEKGRARVSVPAWRENMTPETLVADNIFGRRFIVAAEEEISRFFG